MDQRLTRLEHDARQSRLTMEADGPVDTKTRERRAPLPQFKRCMEIAVLPTGLIPTRCVLPASVMTAPDCSGENAMVDNGSAAPKSCLPPLEMRTTTAAGGLLPTGETSTATKTTFDHPNLRLCLTEETNLRTSTQPVSYDSTFWKNNLLAAPSCRRILETKSEQNRMFDPGGSQGRLRACPFLGSWHALLCEEVHVTAG